MLMKTLQLAVKEIVRNRTRSLLTTLGIVIGVASVITMVTLGDGATTSIREDISALGENMLILMPGTERRGPGRAAVASEMFERDDVTALRKDVLGLMAVAPAASRKALVVSGATNVLTTIIGTEPQYLDVTGHSLGRGRMMSRTELNAGAPVCLLGDAVRSILFGTGNALDQAIRVGKMSCTVVGLLAPKPTSNMQDPNDVVLMPLRTYQRRIAGNRDVTAIYMSVKPARSSALVQHQVELLMRERRRLSPTQEDDFNVLDMAEVVKTVSSATGTMTALLGGIAAVSLLVGGIGIMNIMLVSVTERTREIGIRLAVGARDTDVLLQFLVEAVVLSMLGGLFGVGLGVGLGYGVTRVLHLPLVLAPEMIALAFAFSAFVGVLFGYLPARKAAQMNPIEALRHE